MILNENTNRKETKMKANQKLFTQLLIANCCINKKLLQYLHTDVPCLNKSFGKWLAKLLNCNSSHTVALGRPKKLELNGYIVFLILLRALLLNL